MIYVEKLKILVLYIIIKVRYGYMMQGDDIDKNLTMV